MSEDSGRNILEVQDVQWLQQPQVHMKDSKEVIRKINQIIEGGGNKLQVIFDFDRTLTKHHENGVVTKSSFGILESLPSIPEGFKETSEATLAKYRPIETDPKLTIEEKIPYMLEWWGTGIKLLKGIEWNAELVDEFIKHNQVPYRDRTHECFGLLKEAGVPVLVFSAGIGDVVSLSLKHKGLLTSNVHIVSNFLNIVDRKITGYQGEIIHVFNKNEHMIENSPYFAELAGRSNVILLGDSTGDASMAEGVPHDTVLKIGFLNTNIEESLSQYMDIFDIVLADDQTMDILLKILNPTL